MGYEGLDDSRDVANEEKKRPWEIFPEDDSASAKDGGDKKHVKTKEQEKANREKRRAKINSLKIWISKNRILSVGIILAIIALIVGLVILIINLTRPNTEQHQKTDSASWPALNIPDDIIIEDAITPEYAYDVVWTKLSQVIKNNNLRDGEGVLDAAKFEDLLDAYIRDNVPREKDRPAYELMKVVLLSINGETNRAEYLLGLFDEKDLELGKNTRYFYLMSKVVYYTAIENKDEELKWQEILEGEYPVGNGYIDINTNELITDEEMLKEIRSDIDKIKVEINQIENSETEEE